MTKTHFVSDADSVTEIKPTNIFTAKSCPNCTLPSRVEINNTRRDRAEISCLHCDTLVFAERLYASTTTGECDTRCMFAVGSICNCACGGVNHAGDWRWAKHHSTLTATAVEKLLSQRKKTAARREQRQKTKIEEAARPFNEWLESLDEEIRDIIDWVMIYENLEEVWGWSHSFLIDMRLRMMPRPNNPIKYPARPLTEKQLRTTVNTYASVMRKRAFEAEWNKIKKSVPEGRHEIIGKLISRRIDSERVSRVTGNEIDTYKILIKCDGFKLWGNCPDELIDIVWPSDGNTDLEKTEMPDISIKMRATLKRSRDDESFGFYSRPFNAELLSDAESAPKTEPSVEQQTKTERASEKRSAPRNSSHAQCTHEATKSARAKCRRERASK